MITRLALAIGLLPTTALAQDLEGKGSALDEGQDKRLVVSAEFETYWHEYDNLDFRKRDETSDQSILDSDDRGRFAYTGIGFELGYTPDPHVRLVVSASHRGLWGNDQIGKSDHWGGFIYVSDLYVEGRPWDQTWSPTVRVGRQYFEIGGLAGAPDYVLSDVVDMVRVDVPITDIGHITVIPIEVPGMSGSNDQADFFSYIGQDESQTFGFRGEHMTRRHGLVAVFDGIPGPVDLRAYSFYTDMGSAGTGSDISYNGELGNFADNDWVLNYGVRASAAFGPVAVWTEFDGSAGVDRKELVARDINTAGFAWGGGASVAVGEEDGFRATASYFEAQGGVYADDGLQYSHGYVGLKGRHVGGHITSRFLGWHPSAYVGRFGIDDAPHEPDRKAGTRAVHAGVGGELPGPVSLRAETWFLQDTGVSALKLDRLDEIDPPYGYARDEFAAQERLGKGLGIEIDGNVTLHLGKHVDITADGGVLLPSQFYDIEIARVAGDQLGGSAAAWAMSGGTQVKF